MTHETHPAEEAPAPLPAPSPPKNPKASIWKPKTWGWSWSWVPAGFVVGGAVLAVYLAYVFVERAGDETHPLTNLEQTFFGAYTLVVGAAVSWVLTHYYAQRETREQFKQLARPALRRVTAARESADLVLAAIDRRRRASKGDLEPFKSLRELVEQHARVLDDAIADWQEVLPVEAEIAQQLATTSARDESAFAHIEDRFLELEQAVAKSTESQTPDPRIEELRKEIERLRTELRDRPRGYGLTALGYDYPASGRIGATTITGNGETILKSGAIGGGITLRGDA